MPGAESRDLAAGFAHWTDVPLRPTDVDSLDHVNNVAFAAIASAGRFDFTARHLQPLLAQGCQLLVARVEIDYRRQARFPGTVRVGTRVAGFGRSSIVVEQAHLCAGDVVAQTRTVLVHFDMAAQATVPLPEALRAALESAGASGSVGRLADRIPIE